MNRATVIERLIDWATARVSDELFAGRGDPVPRGTAAYYLREVKLDDGTPAYIFPASADEVEEACRQLQRQGY